jgi:hypothetical protein
VRILLAVPCEALVVRAHAALQPREVDRLRSRLEPRR